MTVDMVEYISENLSCVAATGDVCGEGAVWDAGENSLYWTDINRFLIHRLRVADGSVKTWFFDEPVTALTLTDQPRTLLVVFGSGVCLWNPDTNEITKELFRLQQWPRMRLNDARADARGSLWAGTMTNNVGTDGSQRETYGKDGVLYRINPDGSVSEWKKEIGISNTVAWSPDRTRFYFGDTLANTIFRYEYNATGGEISNEQPFFKNCELGLPDGSTVDSEGYLWNCRFDGGCVIRVKPSGEIAQVFKLPVSCPTTCVFGGDDLSTLYVTSARSKDRLSGCVFALATETRGMSENRFHVL